MSRYSYTKTERLNDGHSRNGFKNVDRVQDQGGPLNLTGGIYSIFRGLNSADQRRDWA